MLGFAKKEAFGKWKTIAIRKPGVKTRGSFSGKHVNYVPIFIETRYSISITSLSRN